MSSSSADTDSASYVSRATPLCWSCSRGPSVLPETQVLKRIDPRRRIGSDLAGVPPLRPDHEPPVSSRVQEHLDDSRPGDLRLPDDQAPHLRHDGADLVP